MKITIGNWQKVDPKMQPLFDGRIPTPSRTIIVESVLAEQIIQSSVPGPRTHVRIWTNSHRATDKVIIGLDWASQDAQLDPNFAP